MRWKAKKFKHARALIDIIVSKNGSAFNMETEVGCGIKDEQNMEIDL